MAHRKRQRPRPALDVDGVEGLLDHDAVAIAVLHLRRRVAGGERQRVRQPEIFEPAGLGEHDGGGVAVPGEAPVADEGLGAVRADARRLMVAERDGRRNRGRIRDDHRQVAVAGSRSRAQRRVKTASRIGRLQPLQSTLEREHVERFLAASQTVDEVVAAEPPGAADLEIGETAPVICSKTTLSVGDWSGMVAPEFT